MRWETNVKNGVTGLDFDRNDIEMNKVGAENLTAVQLVLAGHTLFMYQERTIYFGKMRLALMACIPRTSLLTSHGVTRLIMT